MALAAILLYGYRYWPGVFLGAVLFSFATGLKNREFTVAIVVGNTIGAITCAYLLERLVQFQKTFSRVHKHQQGFIGLACVVGTTLNAVFIAVAECYTEREWNHCLSPQ